MTRVELLRMLCNAADNLNEQLPPEKRLFPSEHSILRGPEAALDSLDLLHFLMHVDTELRTHGSIPGDLALALLETSNDKRQTLGQFAQTLAEMLA